MSSRLGKRRSLQLTPSTSRGSPDVCVTRCRTVIAGPLSSFFLMENQGSRSLTGSSSRSLPPSRSCMMAVAVKSFEMDAIR